MKLGREDLLKLCDAETPSGCLTSSNLASPDFESTKREDEIGSRLSELNLSSISPETPVDSGNATADDATKRLSVSAPGGTAKATFYCSPCDKFFKNNSGLSAHNRGSKHSNKK